MVPSKPNLEPLLATLQTALSSTRVDISEELTEILGYDDMDLVMDILDDRISVAKEVSVSVLSEDDGCD